MTRVKVCCIMSEAEADLATAAGASALGLVSTMPSGPGMIDDALIAAIARRAPPAVATFLLTCRTDAQGVIAHQRAVGTSTVQLVDAVEQGTYAALRAAMPGVKLVQVIHVTGPASVAQALAVAPEVDGLVLDSGNPAGPVKELGGTGRRHNWSISREIRERVAVPVFLAGGLGPLQRGLRAEDQECLHAFTAEDLVVHRFVRHAQKIIQLPRRQAMLADRAIRLRFEDFLALVFSSHVAHLE